MPKPALFYTLVGFDLTHKKSLVYRSTPNIATLHKILDLALKRGARVISIRAIHPLPEPKGDS